MVQINYIDLPSLFLAAQQARANQQRLKLGEIQMQREEQLPQARRLAAQGQPQMLQELAPQEYGQIQHAELMRENAAAQQQAREAAMAQRQQEVQTRNQAGALTKAINTYRLGINMADAIAQNPAAAPQIFGQLQNAAQSGVIDPALLRLPQDGQLTPEAIGQARRSYEVMLQSLEKQQKQAGPKPKDPFDAASGLRKEFNQLPFVKPMHDAAENWQKIQIASPNAVGDMQLVFNFMKLLDPGSTVREGERADAEQAGGVPAQVWKLYNSAITGERLAPFVREMFKAESEKIFRSKLGIFDKVSAPWRRIAEEQGLNPDDVVMPLGYRPKDQAEGQQAVPEGSQTAPGQGQIKLSPEAERLLEKRRRRNQQGGG